MTTKPSPLLPGERVGEAFARCLRARNYRRRTVETYVGCIARLCAATGVAPLKLQPANVADYLSTLANQSRVAVTQKQVLCAAARFFESILGRELGDIDFRAGSSWREVPTVLSRSEVAQILDELEGRSRLRIELLYGCGLRKSELLRLRVQDLDFGRGRLIVKDAKGGKSREMAIPRRIYTALHEQVERVKRLHDRDCADGFGWVSLPGALETKWPLAPWDVRWQWLWPSNRIRKDPETGKLGRWHYCPKRLSREVAAARERARLDKHVKCHTFRHSFATHMIEDGVPIHVLSEILGHSSIETTEIYLHTAASRVDVAGSPLDRLHGAPVVPFVGASVEPFSRPALAIAH